jgi:hypothetical protein
MKLAVVPSRDVVFFLFEEKKCSVLRPNRIAWCHIINQHRLCPHCGGPARWLYTSLHNVL